MRVKPMWLRTPVEDPEDDAGQEEELLPDDAAEGALPSLDEVLQAEAEVLATEIQELEECGDVDPPFWRTWRKEWKRLLKAL